jgi:hypothetical protein
MNGLRAGAELRGRASPAIEKALNLITAAGGTRRPERVLAAAGDARSLGHVALWQIVAGDRLTVAATPPAAKEPLMGGRDRGHRFQHSADAGQTGRPAVNTVHGSVVDLPRPEVVLSDFDLPDADSRLPLYVDKLLETTHRCADRSHS